jgi:hypothetical protein
MVCSRTLRVIEKDAGVCLKECNSLRGTPETPEANAECERTSDESGFDSALDGDIYGATSVLPPDRRFDFDDNPFSDDRRDDAEPDGRMDLLEGTTCLVSSRDLCAWPDSRAQALRKAGR